jgi:hypothetical protein
MSGIFKGLRNCALTDRGLAVVIELTARAGASCMWVNPARGRFNASGQRHPGTRAALLRLAIAMA